ncbi:MAG TPA: EAL domain-containing protein [Acidobacteriaceae bacterium]|jgi:diguanylate cyclase (GGDEF)-like protein
MARPLFFLVCLAVLAHLSVLLFVHNAVLLSNLAQLILPLIACGVTLHQRTFVADPVGRRCWAAVAVSFGIWSLAQTLYVFFMYHPARTFAGVRLDDALWLLFGLPILLAINTTYHGVDRVRWLDRLQEIAFFVVLYALVFLRSDRLNQNTAYIIQNLALLLCCMLRLPVSVAARERRFFIRLGIFLLAYGVLETFGDLMYLHGWKPGSPVDLVWTLPIALYITLTLRDAGLPFEHEQGRNRLAKLFQRASGLSVAALAFLSIGASALLASQHPVPGGIAMTFCFLLFAVRTGAREGAWQEAHGRLEETVLQDTLTGLGNRIQLRTSIGERLCTLSPLRRELMLFLDLDRFKSINDSLGHSIGDRLLIEVSKRLRNSSPSDSIVCRLGGDEFVVLASTETGINPETVGQNLLEALRQPCIVGEHVLRCSASIGVVVMTPGATIEDLLRTADHAMYRAKQLGKNRVQLFDDATMSQMSGRWQLEADLRACVERDEIDIAYQPIATINGSAITGFEALARWNHSDRGAISPGEFIPLAEETGLIVHLGSQILEKATRQVAQWNRAWGTRFTVSVNVSPRQFADPGFVQLLLSTIERTGLDPFLLKLEITESVLMVHEATVKQILNELRGYGIRISLDDFGTGYSSLSFLLSLPVDEVKVDRSFVSEMHRHPERREVVRTVVHLGQSLRKRVVAEGVETEHELSELAAMGCECAQGWLISKPLSPADLEANMPALMRRSGTAFNVPKEDEPILEPQHHQHPVWEGIAQIFEETLDSEPQPV